MKRLFACLALWAGMMVFLAVSAQAAELIPVGRLMGLQLQDDRVVVAAYDDVLGETARAAGLKIGDEILQINGREVTCVEDVKQAVASDGAVTLQIRRGSKQADIHMEPVSTDKGPKLGVYLRQGIAGIGTVTFYDPETGLFGTLGHGVSSGKGGLLPMTRGYAYEARLRSVQKGLAGQPGQLKGEAGQQIGILTKNTPQGVFGISEKGWQGQTVQTAEFADIQIGPAILRCTVAGENTRDYSVEILKIYAETKNDGRNFLIKITDPDLLSQTGGIVQGMSGSPILQNGQLIGAVTHVLVKDPTMGYGIFIDNMLSASA